MLMIVTVKPSICMQSRRAGVQKTYTTVNHSRLICRLAAIFISGGGGGLLFWHFLHKGYQVCIQSTGSNGGFILCKDDLFDTFFFLELLCLN